MNISAHHRVFYPIKSFEFESVVHPTDDSKSCKKGKTDLVDLGNVVERRAFSNKEFSKEAPKESERTGKEWGKGTFFILFVIRHQPTKPFAKWSGFNWEFGGLGLPMLKKLELVSLSNSNSNSNSDNLTKRNVGKFESKDLLNQGILSVRMRGR